MKMLLRSLKVIALLAIISACTIYDNSQFFGNFTIQKNTDQIFNFSTMEDSDCFNAPQLFINIEDLEVLANDSNSGKFTWIPGECGDTIYGLDSFVKMTIPYKIEQNGTIIYNGNSYIYLLEDSDVTINIITFPLKVNYSSLEMENIFENVLDYRDYVTISNLYTQDYENNTWQLDSRVINENFSENSNYTMDVLDPILSSIGYTSQDITIAYTVVE